MSTDTNVAVAASPEGFEYTDLNEVDPNFKAIDQDFYNLKILKAELKEYTRKKDTKYHKAGEIDKYVKFTLAVTAHPNYSGRRLFESLFFGGSATRTLRKIQDFTGVQQVPGSPLADWLVLLSETQPVFKTQVLKIEDREGFNHDGPVKNFETDGVTPAKVNVVNWKEVVAADNNAL